LLVHSFQLGLVLQSDRSITCLLVINQIVYITTHGTGGSRGWRSNQVHPVYQGDYTCPQPAKISVSADGHRTLFIVHIMLT